MDFLLVAGGFKKVLPSTVKVLPSFADVSKLNLPMSSDKGM